jgi:protein-S-isoprenylcysteine O-methyltransferase Ste14
VPPLGREEIHVNPPTVHHQRGYLPAPIIFATGLVAGGLLKLVSPLPLLDGPARWAVGLALNVVGLAFGFAALAAMRRMRTSPVPFKPTTALVAAGPYRISRHPMYVAMLLNYAGLAVLFHAPWSLLLTPLVIVALWTRTMRHEERYMAERFGADYEAYRSRVRPWL